MARGLKPTATITASLRDAGTTEVERHIIPCSVSARIGFAVAVAAPGRCHGPVFARAGARAVRGIADNILVYEDKASREGNPPFQRPSGQYAWGRQVEVFGKLVDA